MNDKLNIGCGTDIMQGYVNMDYYKFKGVDKVWNVNKLPWPFKAGTFNEVVAKHIIEHVDDVVAVMSEIWRVCKPGAIVKIEVPYFSSLNMVKDPTHKHSFSSATFDFFERGKLGKGNYFDESSGIDFKIMSRYIEYSGNSFLKIFNPLCNISHPVYERFFAYIFPAQTLKVVLKVNK